MENENKNESKLERSLKTKIAIGIAKASIVPLIGLGVVNYGERIAPPSLSQDMQKGLQIERASKYLTPETEEYNCLRNTYRNLGVHDKILEYKDQLKSSKEVKARGHGLIMFGVVGAFFYYLFKDDSVCSI